MFIRDIVTVRAGSALGDWKVLSPRQLGARSTRIAVLFHVG